MITPAKSVRVAVLLGGVNSEREVSLVSGRRILDALQSLGYNARPVVYEGHLAATVERLRAFELVFIALHGGEGEDGTLQSALDEAGLRYTGSPSAASRLAMDKHSAKQRMLAAGIPTAPWVRLDSGNGPNVLGAAQAGALTNFLSQQGYPVVVKPNGEGSTVGLTIVDDEAGLAPALSLAHEFDQQVLVEAYIPGRELTVTILDQRPLPIVEIEPEHQLYDYDCKYTAGMSAYTVPAQLPLKLAVAIQGAAQRLYAELDCRHYARVDLRLDPKDRFYCLELNTLPGMTDHSLTPMAAAAAGMDFEALLDRIAQLALAESVPA
ncbi:MAG: D-alanine--D-alanine ligase [Candidatus Marinimicrobia bacterium]|nr:D-alanine--D-alanine ligase [Candidatus Neomarinimicrobiota bacterium]